MTESNFRALCAELHAAVQLYTGQNPAAAGIPANELVARLMDAMANTAAALAQPEPQGPTDEDRPMPAAIRDMPEQQQRWYALGWQAALARWGRPAIEPVPQQEDVHYAWELHDAEGEWQAGGSANSLEDVQREGNRYLQTYSQDGPHKLIIQQHRVTTIEPVPGVEGGND